MAIVTISKGTKSGGKALAEKLSQRLGLPAIDREIIRDAASRYGIAENLLAEQLEKVPTLIQRRLVGDERVLYLVAIQAALAERAEQGDFIYVGHAGHLLLKGLSNVFKVRLIAPMTYRIRQVVKQQGIGEEEARKYIEQIDKGRIQWTKFLYGRDWQDPSLYDAVFNLENLSLDTASAMIEAAVKQPEFQHADDRQQVVDQFALASRIKIGLAKDDRTRGMHLEVEVTDQQARIYGKFLSSGPLTKGLKRSKDDIIGVIRQFPEIKKVEFDLQDAGIMVET